MTRSWAQLPADRPSASQLVSIVTAPEFGHFLDAVSLKHDTVSACAVDKSLWMARVDGKAQLLTSDGGTWAQLKVRLTVNSYIHENNPCGKKKNLYE